MTTKPKFIPRVKESVKRIKQKPPTQKVNKFKLSPEISHQIDELCRILPQVPFFIMDNGKAKIQQQSRGKLVSGADLLRENPLATVNKAPVIRNQNYRQHTKVTRLMNHKVTLNQQYQQLGQKGIEDYVKYVIDLDKNLQALYQQVNEKANKPQIVQHNKEPKATDFGYVEGSLEQQAGWTIEGGEQAFYSALADWEKSEQSTPLI